MTILELLLAGGILLVMAIFLVISWWTLRKGGRPKMTDEAFLAAVALHGTVPDASMALGYKDATWAHARMAESPEFRKACEDLERHHVAYLRAIKEIDA